MLESVAVIELARQGELEPTRIHVGALDVLAHQIAGFLMDSDGSIPLGELNRVLRRAYPYTKLDDAQLESVLVFMRKMGFLKRDNDVLYRTSRTRTYYYENLSMIPDERRYLVVDLTSQQSVGILGEEFMVEQARVGLNFIIKGRVWQMKQITDYGKVYVLPVNDPTAAIPGWDGTILPVPEKLGLKVGAYRATVDDMVQRQEPLAKMVEELSQKCQATPKESNASSRR